MKANVRSVYSDFPFSFFFQSGFKGLKVAYNQSSIFLPHQVFSSSQDSRVVTLVYLTLNDVLSLSKENEVNQTLSASTAIVSSTVEPRPPDVLNKPVKIVLHNKKVGGFWKTFSLVFEKCIKINLLALSLLE